MNTEDLINERRKQISILSKLPDYPEITSTTIQILYQLYDKYFFNNTLTTLLTSKNKTVIIDTSDGMTSTGAKVIMGDSKSYTIKFSSNIFISITPETMKIKNMTSGGITIISRLHAIQLTLEHELVHLFIDLTVSHKEEKHHGALFKTLLSLLFGHTKSTHNLKIPENMLVAVNTETKDIPVSLITKLTRDILRVGEKVAFTCKKDKLECEIIALNPKRAKVKVISTGKLYTVPYDLLYK